VYTLLLTLVALTFRGYVRGDKRLLGVGLGALVLCKGALALLWLLPLLDRRWRAITYGLATIAGGIILAAPLIGLSPWWTYVQRLPDLFNQPWTGVTAYQTVASFVHHMTRADPTFNPVPLVDAAELAAPLSTVLSLLLISAAVAAGWVLTAADDLSAGWRRATRFALVAALAVPLQPVGEEYHGVLLLAPVAVAVALLTGHLLSPVRRHLLLPPATLGILLLASPLPFRSDRYRDGWHALFAYPKLYGALLLAGCFAAVLIAWPIRWPRPHSPLIDARRHHDPA
ncbi:MAG: glycosyltransferase 87 family protein, partial [Vicinamibacterales bacterium]